MADVDFRGPLFNGEDERIAAGMCDDIETELSASGEAMVRAELGHVLKHPTGRYVSSIRTTPGGAGIDVTDGGVVYGPWLEGVGSRNRTTRFKGYATFRRVAQVLDARADDIAERVADPWIARMG